MSESLQLSFMRRPVQNSTVCDPLHFLSDVAVAVVVAIAMVAAVVAATVVVTAVGVGTSVVLAATFGDVVATGSRV